MPQREKIAELKVVLKHENNQSRVFTTVFLYLSVFSFFEVVTFPVSIIYEKSRQIERSAALCSS